MFHTLSSVKSEYCDVVHNNLCACDNEKVLPKQYSAFGLSLVASLT